MHHTGLSFLTMYRKWLDEISYRLGIRLHPAIWSTHEMILHICIIKERLIENYLSGPVSKYALACLCFQFG